MQERIRAFLDIASLVRVRAQSLGGGLTANALDNLASDIERHADAMAAEQPPVDVDRREALARDLYERMNRRDGGAHRWEDMGQIVHRFYTRLVDVIGEIERERPLRVLTVAPDGSPLMVEECRAIAPTEAEEKAFRAGVMVGKKTQPLAEAEAVLWSRRTWATTAGGPEEMIAAHATTLLAANRGEIPEEVRPLKPGEVRVTGEANVDGFGRLPILGLGRAMVDPHGVLAQDLMRAHLRAPGGQFDPPEARPPLDHGVTCPCPACKAQTAAMAEHQRDRVEDEATALAYGTWEGDQATTDTEFAQRIDTSADRAMGQREPWHPKVGDRVRTTEKLTACASYREPYRLLRKANATGIAKDYVFPGYWDVTHDDGTEAPYDESELRPEPSTHKPLCTCPPASEYDPPCPVHGVVGQTFHPKGEAP